MKKVDSGSDQQCVKISLKYLDGSIIISSNVHKVYLSVL